jgi:DNA-binding MarR family transcriptional regulator
MAGRKRNAAMRAAANGDVGDGLGGAGLPDCVCGALRTVTRAVTQLYDDALRPAGLRITQYSLLSRIRRLQPVSAGALVDTLHADQTTLARALKLLEQEGLVVRAAETDRRLKRIKLTEAGERKYQEARKLWTETQHRVVATIGPGRWREAHRRLGEMLAAVEKKGRAG